MSVKVEGLTVSYEGKVALDHIDLEVQDGEFLVILGSSGSGKTTLLRCIAGLLKPTEGRVYIDGNDVTDLYPSERNVAMVFQNFALYPHMTVHDNIALNLKIKGLKREEIEERVNRVAKALQIEKHLSKRPRQLSGGEQQRVGLARAMVRDPLVYLMDEPLSNLDAKLRHEMLSELRRFHEQVKKTIIYVCHDQDEAMALASRIVVLSQGRIVQSGTPEELYDHPATVFVASFIGSPAMNLIRSVANGHSVALGSERIRTSTDFGQGRAVMVGVRPEGLSLSDDGEIVAEFRYSTMMGDMLLVTASLPDGTAVNALVPRKDVRGQVLENSTLRFTARNSKVYIFDAETQRLVEEIDAGQANPY